MYKWEKIQDKQTIRISLHWSRRHSQAVTSNGTVPDWNVVWNQRVTSQTRFSRWSSSSRQSHTWSMPAGRPRCHSWQSTAESRLEESDPPQLTGIATVRKGLGQQALTGMATVRSGLAQQAGRYGYCERGAGSTGTGRSQIWRLSAIRHFQLIESISRNIFTPISLWSLSYFFMSPTYLNCTLWEN